MERKRYHIPYHILFSLLLLSLSIAKPTTSKAQEDEARYNRFQWHRYYWKVYRTTKFNIYFAADASDSIYRYLSVITPDAIEDLRKATLKEVPKDLNIIIYPSIEQLYETNIGAYEPQNLTLPTFIEKGARVVLAYNGSYSELKKQLYEGLARAIWESQLKGGTDDSKASTAKTKTKSKDKDGGIPNWYKEGSIRYFAYGWPMEAEDKLRSSMEQNHFKSWKDILSYEPRLGGQAFCYFLTEKYYPKAVAQTFFQLKKKKSLQRAIRLITKHNLDSLYSQCYSYYAHRFPETDTIGQKHREQLTIHHKKGLVWEMKLNPDKTLVAYTVIEDGSRVVYIYNTQTGLTKKIASYPLPPWIDDHSAGQYPIIEWGANNRYLFVAKPRKGIIEVKKYDPDGEMLEKVTLPGVDGLLSLQQLNDEDFLVTAYKKGQSDIVGYNKNKEKFTAYTDDEYDDKEPVYDSKSKKLYFISDRPKKQELNKTWLIGVGYKKDTLWQGLFTIKNKEIVPVKADTIPDQKWDKPVLLKDDKILLTNTKYGSERNIVLDYNKNKITELGNYAPFQYLPNEDEVSFFRADKDSIYTTQQPIDEWINKNKAEPGDTNSPWLRDYHQILARQAKEDSLLKHGKDTTHYFMDDVFKSQQKGDTTGKKAKNKKKRPNGTYVHGDDKVSPYELQLQSAYFTAQVNNDYFMNRYQPYLNYQGSFKAPEISGLTKGGFTDLFENHHFTIAYALPAATDGSTFFASYENTENKADWGIKYLRKVETLQPDPSRNWVAPNGQPYPDDAKDKTHYYDFFVKDPITYDCYIQGETGIRQDKTVFLATDKYSLDFDPIVSVWSITTISFQLNKLKPTLPFLFKGFKINADIDLFKGFDQQDAVVLAGNVNLRYDFPIYKYITSETQLHTGYSDGSQKILYNLGGEDNNVTPKVDSSVHFPQNAPYAFQTLVTPFRGYYQNSLYGNKYTVFNEDIYFPLFQTLIPLQTPLPSINNLQPGLLTDLGSAQETWRSNPNNAHWLWSYGVSVRTMLAGYPLRLDIAWPGTFAKQPVIYFVLKL